MHNVTLYHTDGCHLCEEALEILQAVLPNDRIECIDIVDDMQLMAQFKTTIPVVKIGVELIYWPFSLEQIKTAL